jgi:TrbB protein
MASALSHAPFLVFIKANQLVVSRKKGGTTRTICSLDLRHKSSFYLSNDGVVCRDAKGLEFSLATLDAEDAQDLLTELAKAQLRHGRMKKVSRLLGLGLAVAIAYSGFIWSSRDAATSTDLAITNPSQSVSDTELAKRALPSHVVPESSQIAAGDGWTLPENIRATLPEKLHNAAERKLFTVDYSSGHDRTLYVFADPNCPNCQRLESSLNTVSDAFNVVVFPVPVIGKEKSIAAITPVLCLPPEQRKAAWDSLFDPAPEGVNLGKTQEKPAAVEVDSTAAQSPGECDVAVKALGINQTAYQAYRIPGTPWVISDDGRYVPQALLHDPSKLHAFISEQPAYKN